MESIIQNKRYSDWLLFFGILLFLFGLIIALFMPILANKRMGLSAHLEGIMNGIFLVILGLIWNKLVLTDKWLKITFWVAIYGSFANFVAVVIAAVTGAGKMMPLAGGKEGTQVVEILISSLLISLSLAMIIVCILILIGLFRAIKQPFVFKN